MSTIFTNVWSGIIAAGFVGFLIALFGSIRHGFNSDGKARPKLKLWLAACFFSLFALLLALAKHPAPLPSPETQERAELFAR